MTAARLAEGGVREVSRRPPETLWLGARVSQEVKCFSVGAYRGRARPRFLQRGVGTDAVNLTEVGAARQSLQRAADGEGGRRLGAPFAAWGGPWTSGGRLLLGELGQQLLNGAVAFS